MGPPQLTATDRLRWLAGVATAERKVCTSHRTNAMSDPSASTWDQQTKTTKAAGIPEIMTAQGMKYYSLLDPASLLDSALEVVTNDGACNSLCGLPFQSELEMRQSLEESAMYLRDLVKAIDSDYGVSKALANGTEPTVPESVSSLHYSVHTKYKETRANAEWASLRDSVQFVGQWCGICDGILWQYVALWVGYLTHTDDLCIPPWDVENGTYQYHGLTPRNILDMLCKLGPENAASWKPYLWDAMMRGVWIQYLEKTGAAFSESIPQANGSDIERDILKKCQTGGMVMCTIETRTVGGQMGGTFAALLAAQGFARHEVCDCTLYDVSLCHGLVFDMSKDSLGIIHNDVTNTLAEKSQGVQEARYRRLVLRQTLQVLQQTMAMPVHPPAEEMCNMFSYSPLVFTRFALRYLERNLPSRLESPTTLMRLITHISEKRRLDLQLAASNDPPCHHQTCHLTTVAKGRAKLFR